MNGWFFVVTQTPYIVKLGVQIATAGGLLEEEGETSMIGILLTSQMFADLAALAFCDQSDV